MTILNLVKVFAPLTLSFTIGIFVTPILSHYLYKYEMWKKKAKTVGLGGGGTPLFNELHKTRETSTPRMGGIVIWLSAIFTVLILFIIARLFPGGITQKLVFLSRDQTWLPLTALLTGALVGFIDDYLEVKGKGDYKAGGLSLSKRLIIVGLIGFLSALWFYYKLQISTIGIPFYGDFDIGLFFIPFFVLVTVAIYSGGVIDGIDGLAGGIFAIIFSSYAVIAFYQEQINLAAFCALLVGGILAFLWFNIPPARFYMSETGSMALTLALAVVAFMTDSLGGGQGVFVLPIIAFPLVATTLSNIIQVFSKKFRNGKKVFRIAPLHHHFEAIGWPPAKVTMRYWVLGVVFAVLGMIVALLR